MKAGWLLGTLLSMVLGFAGVCQTGLLGSHVVREVKAADANGAEQQDILSSEAGWRYKRGQPSHWKYLMMKR